MIFKLAARARDARFGLRGCPHDLGAKRGSEQAHLRLPNLHSAQIDLHPI